MYNIVNSKTIVYINSKTRVKQNFQVSLLQNNNEIKKKKVVITNSQS